MRSQQPVGTHRIIVDEPVEGLEPGLRVEDGRKTRGGVPCDGSHQARRSPVEPRIKEVDTLHFMADIHLH
jgi:hypothetical protein